MKTILSYTILFLVFTSSALAQKTLSGGILGGLNLSTFNTSSNGPEFNNKGGFDAGVWGNVAFGSWFSIEPQVMFTQREYDMRTSAISLNNVDADSRLGFISVPVFVKAKVAHSIYVMVGPQFDFLTSSKTTLNYPPNVVPAPGNESFYDTFKGTSTAITGGIEIAPWNKFSIYARYVGGLVDLNRGDDGSANSPGAYKNSSFHLGVKWKLCGEKKANKTSAAAAVEKDSDLDGVPDSIDRCPETPGLPDNYGCPEVVINYAKDQAELDDTYKTELEKVVTFMKQHPDLNVIIEGYSSAPGTAEHNQKLSEERAKNTVDYLVSKGISADRFKWVGYGETRPIGDNSTAEGRAKNRRVVMRIQK